jgi:parallel beta-helix repeat protein
MKRVIGRQQAIVAGACVLVVFGFGTGVIVPRLAAQSPASAQSQGWANVDCDKESAGALQRAIDRARSGDTVQVNGTCEENVNIPEGKNRITLDGGGHATNHGPDPAISSIAVRGMGTTITALTISGGRDGIDVGRNATAVIDGNTITGAGRFGILVHGSGAAAIVNNTIENNQNNGIVVSTNSFAFVGVRSGEDAVASPNIIRFNGGHGVSVAFSSAARVVGNTIGNNTRNGINVERASNASAASNSIDGNGQNGVYVTENSAVNLGSDTGSGIYDAPNQTTANNVLGGIACRVGGAANGRLGTLNGNGGAKDFGGTCVNSLDKSDTVEP